MGGFVQFVEPMPTPGPVPAGVVKVPPPPPGGEVDLQKLVAAGVQRCPTPLDAMQYGMQRLMTEAITEANAMHAGTLKNGALQKFMLGLQQANNAAKYMHSTKIDAEIKGGSYEADLAAILGIVQGE